MRLNDLLACLTPSPEGRNRAQVWASTFGHAKSHGIPWHSVDVGQLVLRAHPLISIRLVCKCLQGIPLASPSPYISLFPPSGAKASQISGPWPRSDGPMADKHRQASKTSILTGHIPKVSKEPNRSFASPSWIPTTRL